MSYIIYTNSGTILTTIPTGKINTSTTSLTLIGRDVPNYGRYINQNLVSLLTNFSNSANDPPDHPQVGQLWFDTTYDKLKVFNDTGFGIVGIPKISANQPAGQEPGEFWFDTRNNALNIIDNEGQYQTITSFPRSDLAGWKHPLNPIYDASTSNYNVRNIALLQSNGENIGAISTSSFVASSDNSFVEFARAGTSQFEVTEGLTIIGNVKATKYVHAQTGTFTSGIVTGNVNLGHSHLEVLIDPVLNVPDKTTVVGFSTTSNPVSVVLPAPSVGKYLIIKDEGGFAGTNPIIIVPASTATTVINGDCLEIQLNTNYGSYVFYSDGVNWFTVGDTYNFSLSTLQEGTGVTSITGHHDSDTGVGLTSEAWAQLMWVPSTEFISTTDIKLGTSRYNWAFVSDTGFEIENKISTSEKYGWKFNTGGVLELPGNTVSERPKLGDTSHDGGVGLRSPQNKYSRLVSFDGNAHIRVNDNSYSPENPSAAVQIATDRSGSNYRWKFDSDGILTFPRNINMGDVEGTNTFGFYTTNTNMQYLLEAGPVVWNFDAGTKSLELPNGAKIVSANVTQIAGMSADVNYYNYDASNLTVAVQVGEIVNFPNFSGQILINDHVSGGVDLWLAGGGSTVLLGHTVAQTGTLAQNAIINGYSWTSSVNGTMVFVATRTRNSN